MDISRITGSTGAHMAKQRDPAQGSEIPQGGPADSVVISGRPERKSRPKATVDEGAAPARTKATPDEGAAPARKKWTILQYSAADNNLESDMVQDVIDMEKVGSDNNTSLVVQIDRGKHPSEMSGAWRGCRRYFLNKSTGGNEITSPVLQDMGQVNMADPGTLKDFIVWGMKSYPAEHYILIISDHGDAWRGAIEDGSAGGDFMSMKKIGKALADARKETKQGIDIIGFDACLMAGAEVAYEIKDSGALMIASQESEGADGWPYTKILTEKVLQIIQQALISKITISPKELAVKIVRESAKEQETLPTMSAVDLAKMPEIGKASKELAARILATETPRQVLRDIAGETQSFDGLKDYYDFCERIVKSDSIKDGSLKKAAGAVMKSVSKAVVAEEHSDEYKGAHGLHIEIPSWGTTTEEYKGLAFARETNWHKAADSIADTKKPSKKTVTHDGWNVSP
jgi:hypothetical protein